MSLQFYWYCLGCEFYYEFHIHLLLQIVDPKTGDEKKVTISMDDGIRPETALSGLSKLRPVFKKDGTTTAGMEKLHF